MRFLPHTDRERRDMLATIGVASIDDLFADIPKEQASVGALRALATDVDTSTTSKAEYRRRFEAAESA